MYMILDAWILLFHLQFVVCSKHIIFYNIYEHFISDLICCIKLYKSNKWYEIFALVKTSSSSSYFIAFSSAVCRYRSFTVSCIVFRFIFIHFDSTIALACSMLNAQRVDFHGVVFCIHKCLCVVYSVIGNMRQSQCCPYFFTYYIYKYAAYISSSL